MNAALRNAKRQLDKLKKNSGMGNTITADLVLDFSEFDDCSEDDNINILLRCTRADVIVLQRKQSSNISTLSLSD